jgi:hypothetical protein
MSSVVVDIRWSSWGSSKAVGHGGGYFVLDPAKSGKEKGEAAVITAYDLGKCRGRWAYRAYKVYFPKEKRYQPRGISICPSF